MQITKESLEARIRELLSMKEQALANANACAGALQECQRLLAVLVEPDVQAPKPQLLKK